MLSTFQIFFSLLCISNVLFSAESCTKSQDPNEKANIQQHCPAHNFEDNKKEIKTKLKQQDSI